ncbi:MAG TPA: hypothetical protein VMU31_06365 [Rhizomicrobium sp.]|nr:hypothetical protein [Rhizomicrobium sp.]
MRISSHLAVAGLALMLRACAHHQPAWEPNAVITISGKPTAALSPGQSWKEMLARAARVTVAHGHRYFRLTGFSRAGAGLAPGSDIRIVMLDEKRTRDDQDAYLLLEPGGA